MKLIVIFSLGIVCLLAEKAENNQFTVNVFKTIAKNNPKTFLVCPLSAKLVLALAQVGAKGKTADQLTKVLNLPGDPKSLQNCVRKLLTLLEGDGNYELKTAHKIYVEKGFTINKKYKNDAINIFKSEVENINFEKAAKEINKWIEEQTNNKIKNMVDEGQLGPATALVMINAMYFHGKWSKQFEKDNTNKADFYKSERDKISIDMMSTTSNFNYYKSRKLSAEFLEIPYKGRNVTMTFVLPKTFKGLADLEARFADVLAPVPYTPQDLYVTIPKFKIDTKIDFIPILRFMGITEAFDSNADFSGIAKSVPPITAVMQKTFIEVDEEGTTAAASTVEFMSRTRRVNAAFAANRPFIFFLKAKNEVLFLGRYAGP